MKNLVKKISCLGVAFLLGACSQPKDPGTQGGGSSTFIMEAEYTDLEGVEGGGNSVEKSGFDMIYGDGTSQEINSYGWSSGYFVAYTHKADVKLTFDFESDSAVDNATLVIRMASEMGATSFGPDEFEIKVNGAEIDYDPVYLLSYGTLEEMRFVDNTITNKMALKAGSNTITLRVKTNNLTGAGTIGPIIDCVKITSKANLSWTPLVDNPDHRGEI